MRRTIGLEALDEPQGCPWRSFSDPDVAEVLESYELFESGQLAVMIGDDPPAVLVDAITYFHRALASARSHAAGNVREQDRQKRAQK